MSEVVDSHGHFKSVIGPGRLGVGGFVYGRITNEIGEGSCGFEGFEVGNEVADGLQIGEFQFHDGVGSFGHTNFLGHCLFEINK